MSFDERCNDNLSDIRNILYEIADDLELQQIDDPNEPWGPSAAVRDLSTKWIQHVLKRSGVYSVERTRMNTIKIVFKFNLDYFKNNEQLIMDCLQEVDDRLTDGQFDFDRRPIAHGEKHIIEYEIYLGKWSHRKDEWGASYNTFISEE